MLLRAYDRRVDRDGPDQVALGVDLREQRGEHARRTTSTSGEQDRKSSPLQLVALGLTELHGEPQTSRPDVGVASRAVTPDRSAIREAGAGIHEMPF
ncbi:phosphoglucosamine mutase [Streptomyces laurentii]|uniref:Phosphoglucosamine mutase n=1 Tax=Streptomyces laurentii TaxID=39478 RepID=A0A169PNA7_STRLU|nr:phosphoglucosamine mutase [Streptomyces laurentii]